MAELDKVIDLFDKLGKTHAERALLMLLREYRSYLPDEIHERFHKDFRQIDVTPSGKIDMAIWHLLNCCDLFWFCDEEIERAEAQVAREALEVVTK